MSLKTSLPRLSALSAPSQPPPFADLRAFEHSDLGWDQSPTLGGGRVALYGLPPGILTTGGYHVPGRGVMFETTRFGLMPDHFQGDSTLHTFINDFRGDASTAADMDEAVLIGTDWDYNFQHFLVETFPRIYALTRCCSARTTPPIVVAECPHVRDILTLCFPGYTFRYLPKNESVRILRRGLFVSPAAANFGKQPKLLHESLRFLHEHMLSRVQMGAHGHSHPRAYFGRQLVPGYSGNNRRAINEVAVTAYLAECGYPPLFFDGRDCAEKVQLQAATRHAIMPDGANLMNLLFARGPLQLGVICHPRLLQMPWFTELIRGCRLPIGKIELFEGTSLENPDIGTGSNRPYVVDLPALRAFMNRFEGS